MAHELQTKYADLVLAKLRADLVLQDGVVFNTEYEGDPTSGAVKIPVRDTEVSARDYDKASGITPGTGTTSYLTVLVDKDVAINEIIDGYDAAGVPDNIVAERLDSGTYGLQQRLENDGGTELITNGTVVSLGQITKDTVYDELVDLRKRLKKAKVPTKDGKLYCVATPDFYALLLKSGHFTKASDLADLRQQSGIAGRIAGFNIIESNDDTANLQCIVGHPKYATRVKAFSVPPHVVDLDGSDKYVGASAVKGRMVYTHKVTRSAGVIAAYAPKVLTVSCAAATGESDAGKTVATVTGQTSGATLKYRVSPTARAKYGDATSSGYTALTSGTTKITAAATDIIEVVELDSDSKVVAVGYANSVPKAAA